ncbi:hypothetical protein IscW_ISCW005492 [Ixodes scapularis]|uniref:Uncharacterized protein n=1 Tax=Ixodes scapularis TaxID=6945 RepID=B7PPQ3_IXOSC|nr:hypothetical protein IscW_ISCW005492 [Ixodes scapularis]|eukprot:XP_002435745.1 hypothetical protein IscW_ISCW005492 [Ixodes scapularis]
MLDCIPGEPGSRVFGALIDGVFEGRIVTANGLVFYVEPLWKYSELLVTAGVAVHSVMYTTQDVDLPPHLVHHGGCGLNQPQQRAAHDVQPRVAGSLMPDVSGEADKP